LVGVSYQGVEERREKREERREKREERREKSIFPIN
jgi:hypothetical protein